MLGVVIWSCQRTGRAIVWCSDHRDLAHYDGAGTSVLRIEVGDLVEVTLMREKSVRRCVDMKLVEAAYMPEVAQNLRGRPAAIAAA
ncbi:hypothetical protein [Gemmobacter denitrificans]|uniref:Uncharacterized protein n=1 Tax=Gemmobacter denitrificans TaxID=3123040 RepID=A0ABU8BWV8_9RHOB